MGVQHPRLASPSWVRLPRRTARLRLTAFYGGLFLLTGAALAAITYVLFERATEYRTPPIPKIPHTPAVGNLQLPSPLAPSLPQQYNRLQNQLTQAQNQLAQAQHQLAGLPAGPFATRDRQLTQDQHQLVLDLGDTLDSLFARLEAAFEAQRHFVANASHELRTPLTAERTLLQVALDDPGTTTAAWRSTAQEVLASSDEQARLIEALLTLASSESGLNRHEPVDLATTVPAILARLQPETSRLGIHIDQVTEPAILDGDSLLIERLVANLLTNAVRHNVSDGRVEVLTGVQDGMAVLSVTNTGPPIPPADVDRLFQPFQRLDRRRANYKDGHGLGLSIVRAIATAHDATITAHAMPHGGLCVSVSFPLPARPSASPENHSQGDRHSLEIELATP